MMRIGAGLSVLSAGAVAAAPVNKGVVLWGFLGMQFGAAAMVAALFGCTVTRVIIGMADHSSRWYVRVPVDVLAVGVTFFFVVEKSPELFASLASGIFIGSLGAAIIKIAEKWGNKFLTVFLPEVPAIGAPPPPPPPAA